MSSRRHEMEHRREQVQAYLLDTLDPRARAEVEKHLAGDAEWQALLEEERDTLALLGSLPDAKPPAGLAERTAARAAEAEEASPRGLLRPVLLSACALLALVVLAGFPLMRAREAHLRSTSANNLKQLGLVYKMYSSEDPKGAFPPLAPYEGVWAPDLRVLYPDYLSDASVLVNPAHPEAAKLRKEIEAAFAADPPQWERACRAAARSYSYLGHSVTETADVIRLAGGAWLEKDTGTRRGKGIEPLREGIERFFITDINNPAAGAASQSTIPVMFEFVPSEDDPERPSACNVLFMDGHVERIPYGEAFPILPAVGGALRSSSE